MVSAACLNCLLRGRAAESRSRVGSPCLVKALFTMKRGAVLRIVDLKESRSEMISESWCAQKEYCPWTCENGGGIRGTMTEKLSTVSHVELNLKGKNQGDQLSIPVQNADVKWSIWYVEKFAVLA